MVYFYTSGNVRTMRNIIKDYEALTDSTPHEYMQNYLTKCPESTNDTKIAWVAETFLGYYKHKSLFDAITDLFSKDLTDDERVYLSILLHGIIFHIDPKDMDLVYKCLFNLSKLLLNICLELLNSDEGLGIICDFCSMIYDTKFISEKVFEPLQKWQPSMIAMAQRYDEYVNKIEQSKMKSPTIPLEPNVLNRKTRNLSPLEVSEVPQAPPNSIQPNVKKMLTRSEIDTKLKTFHEKNKEKAAVLLKAVKNNHARYAQGKSDKYHVTLNTIKNEMENQLKPLPKPKHKLILKKSPLPIKETATSIKRMNMHIQKVEQDEVFWLQNLLESCSCSANFELVEERERQKRERNRLIDIEKKHLMGQISHEEAILSKQKLQEENKKKYEEFLKQKEMWYDEIENWKKEEMAKNQKQVEKLSLQELSLLEAKTNAALNKRKIADEVKNESETLRMKALIEKNEELEKRINMIKEIKILGLIAKKARVPKVLDLTETSGFRLLCEMSMAELKERLNIFKIKIKEELDRKKQSIKEKNETAKKELEETKNNNREFMTERAMIKAQNKKQEVKATLDINVSDTKELNDLKKRLEEKRKLRMKMTS